MSADEQKRRCGLMIDRVRMPSDLRARIRSIAQTQRKAADRNPGGPRLLLAQATARGLSVDDFVKEIVVREAHVSPERLPRRTGKELIDASAKVRGLLTDEEVDALFSRNPSFARPVDFE